MSDKLDGRVAGNLEKYRSDLNALKAQGEALSKKRAEIDRTLADININVHRISAAIFALTELQKEEKEEPSETAQF